MPQITVGPSAVPIPNNGTDPLYGINVGSTVLWYSKLPDVSPASGTPLSPGNAVQGWPAGQPLYIMSTGGNGSFAYEANGSQIAIGAVAAALLPGSTVDVGNTVGVTGSVDASGSTIDSRAQNNPSILAVNGVVIPASMPLSAQIGPTLTLSTKGYSSILISVGDNDPAIPLASANMVKITFDQTLGGTSVVPISNAHFLLGGLNGFVQVPVLGDTIIITGVFINTSAFGGGGNRITMQVIGSNEVISEPKYLSNNFSAKGTIPTEGYYEVNTGAFSQVFMNSKNGPAELSILAATGASAGSSNLGIVDFDNPGAGVIILAGTGAIPAGGAANVPLRLPMRPAIVTVNPSAGSLIGSVLQ